MSKPRARFDILVVFDDGTAYVRFTSDPKRSLPAAEIAARLREYAGYIENGIAAEALKLADDKEPSTHGPGAQL